jgi:hypothetical protein
VARQISVREVSLAGGLAIVAALVGEADLLPWGTLALWLAAWGLFLAGVAPASWHPAVRIVTAAAALAVALGLWHVTSARAEIRVVELAPVPKGKERPGFFDVTVAFHNVGQWPAEVRSMSQIGLYETPPVEDVTRRAALEEHVKRGLGDPANTSARAFRLAPNERRGYTVTGELSEPQMAALTAGRLTVYIAAEIRYRDWWILERGTRVCAFTSGSIHAIAQCLRYSESW